ncbi:fimbrial protein [Halobacteriovorax sp.]|uniref:fimbrial protein n=1 Tax=Halobacteriovorax sp. TaxID=2020862 RepID=UPI003AF233DE
MKVLKALFVTSLLSTSAFAATTGTLTLTGTVPAIISIEVTPEALASTLPLDTTQTDSKVATVTEKSNSVSGYTVSFQSANLGNLVHESVGSSSIAYDLKYDGALVDLSTTDVFTFPSAASVNVDKDLEISYTGVAHENLVQGSYEDVVTLEIAVN